GGGRRTRGGCGRSRGWGAAGGRPGGGPQRRQRRRPPEAAAAAVAAAEPLSRHPAPTPCTGRAAALTGGDRPPRKLAKRTGHGEDGPRPRRAPAPGPAAGDAFPSPAAGPFVKPAVTGLAARSEARADRTGPTERARGRRPPLTQVGKLRTHGLRRRSQVTPGQTLTARYSPHHARGPAYH